MSKEHYFKIVSNKTNVLKSKPSDLEWTDDWTIYFVKPLYQDQVQRLVREFVQPINELDDMDSFMIWLDKKKKIKAYSIPKIYMIENNGQPFKEIIN